MKQFLGTVGGFVSNLFAWVYCPRFAFHSRIAKVVMGHGFKIADEHYIRCLQAGTIRDKIGALFFMYQVLYGSAKLRILCASGGKHFGYARLSTLKQLATSCPFCWVDVIAELRKITVVDPNDIADITRQIKMLAADDGLNFSSEVVQKTLEAAQKKGRETRVPTLEEKKQRNLEVARKLREGKIPLINENGSEQKNG